MTSDSADGVAGNREVHDALLRAVRDRYLTSGDFNGLYLDTEVEPALAAIAADLVREGLLQVVTSEDYINPHIRPWPSRRSIEEQVRSLDALSQATYGACLYPTTRGMRGVRLPRRFTGRPYEQALARGRGTLELAYFDFAVLEGYRNDPRYSFAFDDFGADMGVSDAVYLDEEEPERDKVSLSQIGFAYDLSGYDPEDPDSPIVRRVAAFYGDLAELSDTHQQRWKTHEVADAGLEPHPVWWGNQMGHWSDGTGPFHRLVLELENINALWSHAFGEPLFKTTRRPRELGWLLRPSQRDWDEFVHQLDKLLSGNIAYQALDAADAPKQNPAGDNVGSLGRLQELMLRTKVPPDRARAALKPLREIRSERQRPAHTISTNISDRTYIHRQVTVLERVNLTLLAIRNWLSSHPNNRGMTLPHSDEDLGTWYRT